MGQTADASKYPHTLERPPMFEVPSTSQVLIAPVHMTPPWPDAPRWFDVDLSIEDRDTKSPRSAPIASQLDLGGYATLSLLILAVAQEPPSETRQDSGLTWFLIAPLRMSRRSWNLELLAI
jgi:hypothetical protein